MGTDSGNILGPSAAIKHSKIWQDYLARENLPYFSYHTYSGWSSLEEVPGRRVHITEYGGFDLDPGAILDDLWHAETNGKLSGTIERLYYHQITDDGDNRGGFNHNAQEGSHFAFRDWLRALVFYGSVARVGARGYTDAASPDFIASDDGKGRFPSFPLPTDNMTKYPSIEPWYVAFEMVTNMGPYGVNLPMWFCPGRTGPFENTRACFRVLRGRELLSLADLVDENVNFQHAAFMPSDFMWWIPRRLGQSSLEFPDPTLMKTRVPDPWPQRVSDATVSTQPMITDWIVGEWDSDRNEAVIHDNSGGHQYLKYGSARNINLGFADGHVETKPKALLRWQARPSTGSHVYVY